MVAVEVGTTIINKAASWPTNSKSAAALELSSIEGREEEVSSGYQLQYATSELHEPQQSRLRSR